MKMGRNTVQRVVIIKQEVRDKISDLYSLRDRLLEHPGTKGMANKLSRIITNLETWHKD